MPWPTVLTARETFRNQSRMILSPGGWAARRGPRPAWTIIRRAGGAARAAADGREHAGHPLNLAKNVGDLTRPWKMFYVGDERRTPSLSRTTRFAELSRTTPHRAGAIPGVRSVQPPQRPIAYGRRPGSGTGGAPTLSSHRASAWG